MSRRLALPTLAAALAFGASASAQVNLTAETGPPAAYPTGR